MIRTCATRAATARNLQRIARTAFAPTVPARPEPAARAHRRGREWRQSRSPRSRRRPSRAQHGRMQPVRPRRCARRARHSPARMRGLSPFRHPRPEGAARLPSAAPVPTPTIPAFSIVGGAGCSRAGDADARSRHPGWFRVSRRRHRDDVLLFPDVPPIHDIVRIAGDPLQCGANDGVMRLGSHRRRNGGGRRILGHPPRRSRLSGPQGRRRGHRKMTRRTLGWRTARDWQRHRRRPVRRRAGRWSCNGFTHDFGFHDIAAGVRRIRLRGWSTRPGAKPGEFISAPK